jgi:hypothetical protein
MEEDAQTSFLLDDLSNRPSLSLQNPLQPFNIRKRTISTKELFEEDERYDNFTTIGIQI